MATVFLNSNENFTLSNNASVYGASGSGTEKIIMLGTPTLLLDQNIESLALPNALNHYTFKIQGNQALIQSGSTLVATIGIQGDSDGTRLIFADGAANLKITGLNTGTLGNSTLTTTFATVSATLDTTDKSGTTSTTNTTTTTTTNTTNTTTPTTNTTGTGTTTTPTTSTLSQLAQTKSAEIATVSSLPTTSDTGVTALNSNTLWSKKSLTYSFNKSIPSDYTESAQTSGWQAFNSTEEQIAKDGLNAVQDLTQLTFSLASNNGDLRFNKVNTTSSNGFAYYPSDYAAIGGDVFIANTYMKDNNSNAKGSYGYYTVLHEIGHALGLKHSFEDGTTLASSVDNHVYTLMSYTEGRNLRANFTITSDNKASASYTYSAQPSSYSLYDVSALQAMYGANMNTRTGSNTYTISRPNFEYKVIWDAGGNDTIDVSNATYASTVDLRPNSFSTIDYYSLTQQKADTIAWYKANGFNSASISNWVEAVYNDSQRAKEFYTGENNLAIAKGAIIENVITGASNDTVRDNQVNNIIVTGTGNDTIQLYEGGYDTVNGGAGTDTVQLNQTATQVQVEKNSSGYLIVGTNMAAQLIGIEKLLFSDGTTQVLA